MLKNAVGRANAMVLSLIIPEVFAIHHDLSS
jgi:hypothetical protein